MEKEQEQEQQQDSFRKCLLCCFGGSQGSDPIPTHVHPHPHEGEEKGKEGEQGGGGGEKEGEVAMQLPYLGVDGCLRGLAGSAEGFGSQSIGGLHGLVYHVTNLDEDGKGSLRKACKSKKPLWIVFDVSGTINLTSGIHVKSFKTIDGRGQRVKLMGNGLQLHDCEHVIVCNLEFEAGRGHDVDGIQLKPNSRHVWIDRCTLSDYDDGLIDITRASTDVTVSRCHFFNHDKTMLIGADPKHTFDRCIRVTIHHCFYDGTQQRHPRLRFGKVHLYNNYTRNWGIYAVCAGVEAQILSQSNVYEAGENTKVFEYYTEKAGDRDFEEPGSIRSEGDLLLNGCEGNAQNPDQVFKVEEYYSKWTMVEASENLANEIVCFAGWQNVALPVDASS